MSRTDAATQQQVESDGEAALADNFGYAPNVRSREEITLRNIVESQKDSQFEFYAAGVSKLEYEETAIEGASATTVARVETWSQFAMLDGAGQVQVATPTNTLIVRTSLSLVRGRWAITDLVWTFDPATAP